MTDEDDPHLDAFNGQTSNQAVQEAVLRRLNHVEWLNQFASVLMLQPAAGPPRPMTPMKAGTISRLKLAAAYIELLQAEARDQAREIEALKHELSQR